MSGHWSGEDPGTGFMWLLGLAVIVVAILALIVLRVAR